MPLPFWPFGRRPRRVVEDQDVKRKKVGRPSKAEVLQRQQMRLAELETRLKMKALERKLQQADADPATDLRLSDLPRLQESLRMLGFKIVPTRSAEPAETGPAGMLRDLLDTEAGKALASSVGAALAPAIQRATQSAPPPAATGATAKAIPPSSDADPSPATTEGSAASTVQTIIGVLEKVTPAEAAGLLLEQAQAGQPSAVEVVQAIIAMSDDRDETIAEYLATKLREAPAVAPDLVPLFSWLASAERFPWFCAAVRHVRQALRAPTTASG